MVLLQLGHGVYTSGNRNQSRCYD